MCSLNKIIKEYSDSISRFQIKKGKKYFVFSNNITSVTINYFIYKLL